MASKRYLKFNVIFLIFTQTLAKATNYLSDNTVGTNEPPEQSLYSDVPQEYFLSYQKYIPSLNHNYVISQPESQIPVSVSSTEKTLYSSAYRSPIDSSKYVTNQVIKPVQETRSNQINYPYTAIVKGVPSTTVTYKSNANDYTENVPKKYQYGYRVSNPHSGTEFGHSEVNDGLTARGYYHVLLPDGRLQNVKYWAGPSGYHATITYETQY